MTRAAFWYSGPRPAVYAATRADHSSGVRAPPSRLRSISGTTNISGPPPRGDVDARWPVAPHPGVRPARGARTLGGPGPRDRGAPHRARGHGDQGARSADRAAALSRVPFARIIYDEAMKAVKLDSTHDGAYHVLGSWNAEIKRLSGIQRFFAKALFGAGFMDKANWPDAQRYLEKAVAWKPGNIFHRLELAEVYMDVGKFSAAREQLTAIAGLPLADVLDHEYKEDAVLNLKDIAGQKDKT